MRGLGCSIYVARSGQIVSKIYTQKLEALDHLLFLTIDGNWGMYYTELPGR